MGINLLGLQTESAYNKKKRKVKTLRLIFKGGRWDSTAEGEARIPLKIKSILSSQPATTFPLATKKQSAKGAYFDGGDFGCLQTEITYNKKTQGKNLASAF